jgi:uncharacterized protein YjdB
MKGKRFVSLAIAVILAVAALPALPVPTAMAADNVGLDFLLRGFNMLSGRPLENSNIDRNSLLKPGSESVLGSYYEFLQSTGTTARVSNGRTLVELMSGYGIDVSTAVSTKFSLGSLFKMSAGVKYSHSAYSEYKSSYDSYFYQMRVDHTEGKNYIKGIDSEGNIPADAMSAIQKQLDPAFLSALINAKDIQKDVFEKYGTHFITSYMMGGRMETDITAFSATESFSEERKNGFETQIGVEVLGVAVENTNTFSETVKDAKNTANYSSYTRSDSRGGAGGIILDGDNKTNSENIINNWSGSFIRNGQTGGNCQVLADGDLVMTGIWELLPTTYTDRYAELMFEYTKLAANMEGAFADGFVYKNALADSAKVEDAKAVSTYNPGSIIEIDSKDKFFRIGTNDTIDGKIYTSNGIYALTKDLVFSASDNPANWGVANEPFTGTFDGRGYSISGYTAVVNCNNGTSTFISPALTVGLFPVNNGTIKNLTVKNAKILYSNYKDGADQKENDKYKAKITSPVYIAGILTGRNAPANGEGGVIEGCCVEDSTVEITLSTSDIGGNKARVYSGGIAGENSGDIRRTSFTGSNPPDKPCIWARSLMGTGHSGAETHAYAGGIAGYMSGGTIEDCYTTVNVESVSLCVYGGAGGNRYVYSLSGGIAGMLFNTKISRCFSDGKITSKFESKEYKTVSGMMTNLKDAVEFSKHTNTRGQITGYSIGGIHEDCFVRSGQTAIGYASFGTGYSGVDNQYSNYNDNKVLTVLNKGDNTNGPWNVSVSHPILKPYDGSGKGEFILEYTNGKPVFTVGGIIGKSFDIKDIMKVHFTPEPGTVNPTEITSTVQLRYNFDTPGDDTGVIQFLYTYNNIKYIGKKQFKVNEQDIYVSTPDDVRLSRTAVTMKAGSAVALTATVIPLYANPAVTWSSDNEDVATVNERGEVYAQVMGTAVITVTTEEGGHTAQCTVTVVSRNSSDEFIDYDADEIIVYGSEAGFYINLTWETITLARDEEESPVKYTVKTYSIDGGEKWKDAKDAFSAAKFPKLLGKDMTLHISDKPIDKKTKKPAEGAQIVTFPTIQKRAAAPKLTVNYLIAADLTGETAGEWVLSEKGGSAAVKEGIEIGAANSKKKAVDENGFGKFRDGAGSGVAVKPLTGTKPVKSVYFIRIAPAQSGNTYTAASKTKKITVTSEQKKPNYKADAKKGVIKVKAGTYVSINGGTPELYSAKAEIPVTAGTFDLWQAATAKKPASAKQTITK